ncbi:hypothetical protein [Clostridium sp. MCC353]|uniref:hypothetical protein n=1 Tax=Clostridium sp. MCC353 TaxID=2592646 RepID=UPI00207AB4DE|nr:hypothetical protein [Clostridium sp. MCC353]
MKKMRCFLSNAVIFVLAAGILTGCTSQPGKNIIYETPEQDTEPQTNLTFFGFKYEALNVMAIEDSLHSFMDDYPDINISYDGIKSPKYFEILEKRISTGHGDDIFMVDPGSGIWTAGKTG